MSTVLKDVNAALVTAYIAAMAPASLPTAYELKDFTPPASAPWAAVHILEAGRSVSTMGGAGQDEYSGIFQIDIHVPENDGTKNIHAYIQSLLDYFSAGRRLIYNGQGVRVRRSSPSSIRRDEVGASYVKSVSVYWDTWSTR